jgi:hypothetical protein
MLNSAVVVQPLAKKLQANKYSAGSHHHHRQTTIDNIQSLDDGGGAGVGQGGRGVSVGGEQAAGREEELSMEAAVRKFFFKFNINYLFYIYLLINCNKIKLNIMFWH